MKKISLLIVFLLLSLSSCKRPTTATTDDVPIINVPQIIPASNSLVYTLNGNEFHSGTIAFGNAGLGNFTGVVTGISSNPAVTIDASNCIAGLVSGDVCTVTYNIVGYLMSASDLSVTIKIQNDSYVSSPFTLTLAKTGAVTCPAGYHSDKGMCVGSLNTSPLLVSATKTDGSSCLARVDTVDKALSCILSPLDGSEVFYSGDGILYDDRTSMSGSSGTYYVISGEGLYKIKNGETYPYLISDKFTYLSEPMPSQMLHFNSYSILSGYIDGNENVILLDADGNINNKLSNFTLDYLVSKNNQLVLYDSSSEYYVLDMITSLPSKIAFPYAGFLPVGYVTPTNLLFKSKVSEARYVYNFTTGSLTAVKTLSNAEIFDLYGNAQFSAGNSYISSNTSIAQTDFFLYKNLYVVYHGKILKNDLTSIVPVSGENNWSANVQEGKNFIYGINVLTNEVISFLSLDSVYDGSIYNNYEENSLAYSNDNIVYSYNHFTQTKSLAQFTKVIDTVYKAYSIFDYTIGSTLSKSYDMPAQGINTINLSSVGFYSVGLDITYMTGVKAKSIINDISLYNINYNYKVVNGSYSDTLKVANFNNTNGLVYESSGKVYRNFTSLFTLNNTSDTTMFNQDVYLHFFGVKEYSSDYDIIKSVLYKIKDDGAFTLITVPSGFSYLEMY